MRLRKNRKGIAGVYEDIIALILVVLSLTIFFYTVGNVYNTYYESARNSRLTEQTSQLLGTVRSYDKLLGTGTYTGEPVEGRYSLIKLKTMTNDVVKSDIRPSSNCQYSVTIVDKEDQTNSWIYGYEVPKNVVIRSMSTAVVIMINDLEYHVGVLRVQMWYA